MLRSSVLRYMAILAHFAAKMTFERRMSHTSNKKDIQRDYLLGSCAGIIQFHFSI